MTRNSRKETWCHIRQTVTDPKEERFYYLCIEKQVLSRPGAEIIKLFFMLNSADHEFKMLINIEIAKFYGFLGFNSLEPAIYPANKC